MILIVLLLVAFIMWRLAKRRTRKHAIQDNSAALTEALGTVGYHGWGKYPRPPKGWS